MGEREESRAELLPEEQGPGSDNSEAQADQILAESDQRSDDRDAAPDTVVEHRTSADTVAPER